MTNHRQLIRATAGITLMAPTFGAAFADNPPQQDEGKTVVGQVGHVLKASPVFSRPSSSSRSYFTAKQDDYLVVRTDSPQGWIKVLLNTGHFGYISADAIDPMDFEVKAAPKPRPTSLPIASRSSAPRASAVDRGMAFIGTPYKWGGNDITGGIDCSGFVQQLYGSIGINLPRTAAEQALVGTPINRLEDLRKGDRLYFWDSSRSKIGHTGLYLGGGMFLHSSSSHGGVNTDDLRTGHWLKILVAARR